MKETFIACIDIVHGRNAEKVIYMRLHFKDQLVGVSKWNLWNDFLVLTDLEVVMVVLSKACVRLGGVECLFILGFEVSKNPSGTLSATYFLVPTVWNGT